MVTMIGFDLFYEVINQSVDTELNQRDFHRIIRSFIVTTRNRFVGGSIYLDFVLAIMDSQLLLQVVSYLARRYPHFCRYLRRDRLRIALHSPVAEYKAWLDSLQLLSFLEYGYLRTLF